MIKRRFFEVSNNLNKQMNFLTQLVLISATQFSAHGLQIDAESGVVALMQPKIIVADDGKFEIRSGYCDTILATGD